MKKTTKHLLAVILLIAMLIPTISASASESQITPRYSTLTDKAFLFSVSSNGGVANVTYSVNSNFERAEITIKVQKRFLLVIWNDVGEWSSSSTDRYGIFSHVFSLNGSGMYRATFTLKIYGANGTVDTVEETIESKY